MVGDQLDLFRKMIVDYNLYQGDVDQLDETDISAILHAELITRCELENSLKEMFKLISKKIQRRMLTLGTNTKIWYREWLVQEQSK